MHIQLARCSLFPLFCSSSFSVCRRELNPVLCAGCCCCWLINNTHGRTATQLLFDFLLHCFVFLGNYFDAVSLCVNSRNFHEPLRHTRAFIANICWRLLWLSGSQTWNSLVDDNAPNAVEITITSGHCDDSLAVFSFSQTMVYFLQIHLIRYTFLDHNNVLLLLSYRLSSTRAFNSTTARTALQLKTKAQQATCSQWRLQATRYESVVVQCYSTKIFIFTLHQQGI